ncbi:MAG: PhnD/SsuA/transferrin family substrate-binding protein [Pseudomonadota bacterium]
MGGAGFGSDAAGAIAALPMYDHPALRAATDALWAGVAARLAEAGLAAPATLSRGPDLEALWQHPGLVLGQTCGFPFAYGLAGSVQLVGHPVYDVPGCEGPDYRSVFVVAEGDAARALADCAGYRPAVNGWHSQSGHNALRAAAAALTAGRAAPHFAPGLVTGAHLASAEAVADGRADIAALDCVTWDQIRRFHPALAARLRAVGESPAAPGLPFVMAASYGEAVARQVLEALADALADTALDEARSALRLTAVLPPEAARFDAIRGLRSGARMLGQPPLVAVPEEGPGAEPAVQPAFQKSEVMPFFSQSP